MNIQSILFDLDNTLLNRQKTFENYLDTFISKYIFYNSPIEKKEIKNKIIVMDNKGDKDKKELFAELQHRLKWRLIPSVDYLVEEYKTIFAKNSIVMDGTFEVLTFCRNKNFKLGIITNGESFYQKIKLNNTNLNCFFDFILISEEFGKAKPHCSIFKFAIDKMAINPQKSIFIGDNLISDIYGASRLGFYTVWYNHSNVIKQNTITVKPNKIITSLSELFKIKDW
ncbi:HAD family hydrolase [Bacillus nakamurai]|uniref:HAD family hydrolase n=1 Tax=Bacillus nakamurai TaxID=1793963 RepID=UPI001E6252D9|nr:HAD family hydrolase [Bacillus nakamurai]MCC9022356.1 HAD family hydrolase [Bacillus nakamurai]